MGNRAWRNTAEFVSKYFTKGRMAVVSGRLQIRNWQDKEGNKRRSAEVVADNVYFGDSKRDYKHERLDFNRDFIRHPEATFFGDVTGDSMKDAGIFDGDRVIIDRAVQPERIPLRRI